MGDCLWLSESKAGERGTSSFCNWGGRPEVVGSVIDLSKDAVVGSGGTWGRTSLSFFRYFSLSFNALSKSLFKPKIMALCLSTSLHSCEFCCACDAFSFKRYWITASALPAALIRLPISKGPVGLSTELLRFLWDCELVEMAEMAESMDELRGAPLAASTRGPAMVIAGQA